MLSLQASQCKCFVTFTLCTSPLVHNVLSTAAKSATTATTIRFRRKERRLMSYCTSDADAERRKGTANRFPGRRWSVMDSASNRSGDGGGGLPTIGGCWFTRAGR